MTNMLFVIKKLWKLIYKNYIILNKNSIDKDNLINIAKKVNDKDILRDIYIIFNDYIPTYLMFRSFINFMR